MKSIYQRFFALPFVLLLAACAFSSTTTTYEYMGKTYQVLDYRGSDVQNVTLYEIVDGERKWSGFYTIGTPVPEEEVYREKIENIVRLGTKVGDPEKKSGTGLDGGHEAFDPDLGGGE